MKPVTLVAYGALIGAALIYLLLLRIGLMPQAVAGDAVGGKAMSALIISLPFLGCLLVAGIAATAGGGFDWIGAGRGAQYMLVLLGCVGVVVVTALATGLRGEPLDQIPWIMRSLVGWAMFVVPPLALVCLWVMVSAGAGGVAPPVLARALAGGLGTAVIAVLLGLGGELIVFFDRQNRARVEEIQAFDEGRDSMMFAQVQAMDAATDFVRLLNFTNRYEKREIRELALQKLQQRDDFTAALAASVAAGGSGEALIYLAGNEPPDPDAAAPIAVEAIHASARYARRLMEEAHHLQDDTFEGLADRVLTVADRLAGRGIDFTPAVREFRAALDTPREQAIRPPCKRTLDAWLARQGAGAGAGASAR